MTGLLSCLMTSLYPKTARRGSESFRTRRMEHPARIRRLSLRSLSASSLLSLALSLPRTLRHTRRGGRAPFGNRRAARADRAPLGNCLAARTGHPRAALPQRLAHGPACHSPARQFSNDACPHGTPPHRARARCRPTGALGCRNSALRRVQDLRALPPPPPLPPASHPTPCRPPAPSQRRCCLRRPRARRCCQRSQPRHLHPRLSHRAPVRRRPCRRLRRPCRRHRPPRPRAGGASRDRPGPHRKILRLLLPHPCRSRKRRKTKSCCRRRK